MLAKRFLKKEVGPARRQAGFTLIELLVVIVIISIMAVFLFVSFSQVQKSARDQQRKSDLGTVAGALQRFYSDNARYPSAVAGKIAYNNDCTVTGPPIAQNWGTGVISCTPTGGSLTSYIKQLPKDPTGTPEYCYTSADEQHYILYAALEGSSGTSGPYTNPGGCSGTYNFQITPND